jgi:hypothetical protein
MSRRVSSPAAASSEVGIVRLGYCARAGRFYGNVREPLRDFDVERWRRTR